MSRQRLSNLISTLGFAQGAEGRELGAQGGDRSPGAHGSHGSPQPAARAQLSRQSAPLGSERPEFQCLL